MRELVGTIQAVLEAQLQDHTSDGESAQLASLSYKTRKIPKRQKYSEGDILKAVAANGQPVYARVFEINPKWGPLVGVYDSLGMPESELDSIINKPLIVKVFPIHRETLEMREWLVIGNRSITATDDELPRGQIQLSGANQQLETANYYYGLGSKTYFNIDDFVVKKPADNSAPI